MNDRPARMREEAGLLGARVRAVREQRGLTRGQLGYRTGVTPGNIARIERGEAGAEVTRLVLEHLDIDD